MTRGGKKSYSDAPDSGSSFSLSILHDISGPWVLATLPVSPVSRLLFQAYSHQPDNLLPRSPAQQLSARTSSVSSDGPPQPYLWALENHTEEGLLSGWFVLGYKNKWIGFQMLDHRLQCHRLSPLSLRLFLIAAWICSSSVSPPV